MRFALLSLVWFTVAANASQFTAWYAVTDFGLRTGVVTRVTLTPTAKGGNAGTAFLIPTTIAPGLWTNGTATFSNLTAGYIYRSEFQTTSGTYYRTNYFPDGLTGYVSGSAYTSNLTQVATNGTAPYVVAGTNSEVHSVATSTGVVYVVSSTAAAGGAATNVVWPAAGANMTAVTNGLVVTLSADATAGPTNWSVANVTNAGSLAYSNAAAVDLAGTAQNATNKLDVDLRRDLAQTNSGVSTAEVAGIMASNTAAASVRSWSAPLAANQLNYHQARMELDLPFQSDATQLVQLSNTNANTPHGLVYVRGSGGSNFVFCVTRTYGTITRFDPENVSNYTTVELPAGELSFTGLSDLIYVPEKDRLYACCLGANTTGAAVVEVNPYSMEWVGVTTNHVGDYRRAQLTYTTWSTNDVIPGFDSLASDGRYLYLAGGSYLGAVWKYDMQDWTLADWKPMNYVVLPASGRSNVNPHAVVFDGTDLFVTGLTDAGWVAKVSTNDLSITTWVCPTNAAGAHGNRFTDDQCEQGDFVYAVNESSSYSDQTNGIVLRRIHKALDNEHTITFGLYGLGSYGCRSDGRYVWTMLPAANGVSHTNLLARTDPETLITDIYRCPAELQDINEFATDGQRIWITGTYSTPYYLARVDIGSIELVFRCQSTTNGQVVWSSSPLSQQTYISTLAGNGSGLTNLVGATALTSNSWWQATNAATVDTSTLQHGSAALTNLANGDGGALTNLGPNLLLTNADIYYNGAVQLTTRQLVDSAGQQVFNWESHNFPTEVNGAKLTNLNASSLASGTIPNARMPATQTNVVIWSSAMVTNSDGTFCRDSGGALTLGNSTTTNVAINSGTTILSGTNSTVATNAGFSFSTSGAQFSFGSGSPTIGFANDRSYWGPYGNGYYVNTSGAASFNSVAVGNINIAGGNRAISLTGSNNAVSLTGTNNYVAINGSVQIYDQSTFPTNLIPAGSATLTNVAQIVYRGTPLTVATNRAVGGWMRWRTTDETWQVYNP